jgi:type II secretory pathway pseudopilin PulG
MAKRLEKKIRRRSEAGFSFIELVLAILLIGVTLPALMMVFQNVVVTSAQADLMPKATSLAEGLMEEIKSRKFDELTTKSGSGNWSTTLGPDTGEGTTKANYDDVDDFNAWTQNFASPYTGFSASVSVAYVSSSNLNSPLTIPGTVPSNWTPSYKRVVVTVANAGLPASVTLTTIMTEAQSL